MPLKDGGKIVDGLGVKVALGLIVGKEQDKGIDSDALPTILR